MKVLAMALVTVLGIAACAVEPVQEPETLEQEPETLEQEPETSETSQGLFNGICIAVVPGTRPGNCIAAPLGFPCRLSVPDPISGSVAGQCQPVQLIFPTFDPQYLCTCRQGPLENI